MAKGDIILITFPFTDLSDKKLRPAVVLAETEHDVTVAFITSQLSWEEITDIKIEPSTFNGLKSRSIIRLSKIATLDLNLVKGVLGKLIEAEIGIVNTRLKHFFKIE